MNTLKNRKYLIKDVGISKDKLFIELYPKRIVDIPLGYTEKLKNASIHQLEKYRIIGGGIGIHFEEIDEDISVDGIVKDFIDKYQNISLSFPIDVLENIDNYAQNNHISRSLVIQEATKIYIQQQGIK